MRKLLFAALAGVFMLSSGFSIPSEPNLGNTVEETPVIINTFDSFNDQIDFEKICRYRFVNSEGETIDVVDIRVADTQDCNDPAMIEAAWAEHNKTEVGLQP